MSIPQWTAAWRPDIRQLLHLLQDATDPSQQATTYAVDELQVDFYVRQLYAHSYLEPSTERMKNAAEGVVRTLEFHHRNRHAARISTIFFGTPDANLLPSRPPLRIPTRIACLLLELANSPLSITPTELDEIDLVRIACESRSSKAFHDEQRAKAATRALVGELNQLTMEDPWFTTMDEDNDDALWASDDDTPDESEGQRGQPPLSRNTRAVPVQEPVDAADKLSPKASDDHGTSNPLPVSLEPEPPLPVETYQSNKPWLLYQGYAASLGQLKTPLRFLEKTILPEHHFVEHVLLALLGCTSTTFDGTPVSSGVPFWSTMCYTKFSLASESLHLQSVSHLTPACLYQSLSHWSAAATALSFLRAAATHLGSFPASTLQGSSHALSEFVRGVERPVSTLMRSMLVLGTSRPTLIQLLVDFERHVDNIHWLCQVVQQVLQPVELVKTPTVRHLVATVLTSLADLLEQYTLLEDRQHYALLVKWFGLAIGPYLQRVHDFLDGRPAALELGFDVDPDSWTPFARALFRTVQLPPSTAPPRFMQDLQTLLLEAHAYAIVCREASDSAVNSSVKATAPVSFSSRCNLLSIDDATPWSQTYVHAQIPKGLSRVPAVEGSSQLTWECSEEDAIQVPPLSFDMHLKCNLVDPLRARCLGIGQAMGAQVKTTWRVVEHWQTIRLFLLQYHPDTSSWLSEQLLQHIVTPALRPRWRDGGAMSALFRRAMTKAPMNEPHLDHAEYISLKLHLASTVATAPSLATFHSLDFHYAAPGPLKLLFRTDVMARLSKLGILLLQIQGVERALVSLKQSVMRRLPKHSQYKLVSMELVEFTPLECKFHAMHVHLVDLAAMLHFVKQMHAYFRQQTGSDLWDDVADSIARATLVSEMNDAMEKSIHHMLERCLLLEKHASMHEYLMQLLNRVVHYTVCFDQVVSDLDGNADNSTESSTLAAAAGKFKQAHGYIMLLLHAMAKSGSAPHLHELVLQLNFNGVYSVD